MDDRDLIRAHMSGDPDAFGRLVERYADRLYSFAFHTLRDAALAEDVAQEAFIKAWKGMGRFDESKPFKTWLFTVARNAAVDTLRKRKDIPFSVLDGDDGEASFAESIPDDAPLADAVVATGELRTVLDEVMAGLSVIDRSIVLLHDVEGMTFEEIAGLSDRPTNTVKSRYRRAVFSLRERLLEKGVGPRAPKGSV